MSARIFLYSNIVVYGLHKEQDLEKTEKVAPLVRSQAYISNQVISETLHVAQRKFKADALASRNIYALLISRFVVSPVHLSAIGKSLRIREDYRYSQYDSQIIAVALECGCDILYSEGMNHRQIIYEKLTIVNPFL